MGDTAMVPVALDDDALLASAPLTFGGNVPGTEEKFRTQFLINDRRATIAYESFGAGDTVTWSFWHDEVHYVTRGRAQVTYTLAPNHRKIVAKRFAAGDTYLIPNGARVTWEVEDGDPYLHLCVIMPRFEYSKDERIDAYE